MVIDTMLDYGIMLTKWGLLLVAGIVLGITHYQFAKANYPKSREWTIRLLLVGYFAGSAATWVAIDHSIVHSLLLAALVGGPITSYISLKLIPQRSKTFMPPRNDG